MKLGGQRDKLLGYLEGTGAKDKVAKPEGQEGYMFLSADGVRW